MWQSNDALSSYFTCKKPSDRTKKPISNRPIFSVYFRQKNNAITAYLTCSPILVAYKHTAPTTPNVTRCQHTLTFDIIALRLLTMTIRQWPFGRIRAEYPLLWTIFCFALT